MRAKGLSQEAADAALSPRREALEAKSRQELTALPEVATEELVLGGFRSTLATYREHVKTGAVRIVVQLESDARPFLKIFRSSQVFVQGFDLEPDGRIRRLRQDELYDYN